MSSPTQTVPPAETGFDPLVFWIEHKNKVLLFTALFLFALGAFGISEYTRRTRDANAARLFASAKTADEFRKVIAEYPATTPAGNAHVLLAEQLRKEGKLDESSALLRTFAEKYPDHPLVSGALTSLATNLEAQGKTDEALAAYQRVSTAYASSFSAPAALMAQARLLKAKGKTDEAQRIYEQVMTQYQDNVFAQQAMRENRQLKK